MTQVSDRNLHEEWLNDTPEEEAAFWAGLRTVLSGPALQAAESPLIAAGLAVLAQDTGRVLMLQRSYDPENNRAPGMWEFPGGNLEEGEDPFRGARREWEEETGEKLPPGQVTGEWTSPNGVYRGFVYQVLDESVVYLNADPERRHILNPDDPDGDGAEVIA